MKRINNAIARKDGDMFIGLARDFPLVRDWLQVIDIPVILAGDLMLLKMKPALRAQNASGNTVSIVSYHSGRYYGATGETYREKDLVWI